jgi:hypothetical protein
MAIGWHNLAQWMVGSAALVLVGCGGNSQSDSGDHGSGVECEYEGETYEPGDDFPAADGCNSCTCGEDGDVGCTEMACPPMRCDFGGSSYEIGETFPAGDGCNGCMCTEEGVTCTTIDCNDCQTIGEQYSEAHAEARRCNPDIDVEQCTEEVTVGLACSCPSFLNPENADAIAQLADLSSQYRAQNCSSGVVCGMCLVPVRGTCSSAGVCEDVASQ